jgi:nicotinamidase-related amidase
MTDDVQNPTALVVIDVQLAMVDEFPDDPAAFRRDELLANINTLLDSARESGAKVIYVRHLEPGYELMRPGHPGFEVHPAIAPLPTETVIDKTACDAFCGTELESLLRDAGVTHLAVCGMQTDFCVDSSSRSALHRQFNVTLASDAHTTWDNSVLTAEQIINHHNEVLPSLPGPGTRIRARQSADIQFAPAAT